MLHSRRLLPYSQRVEMLAKLKHSSLFSPNCKGKEKHLISTQNIFASGFNIIFPVNQQVKSSQAKSSQVKSTSQSQQIFNGSFCCYLPRPINDISPGKNVTKLSTAVVKI
jgi:hypothetical protein